MSTLNNPFHQENPFKPYVPSYTPATINSYVDHELHYKPIQYDYTYNVYSQQPIHRKYNYSYNSHERPSTILNQDLSSFEKYIRCNRTNKSQKQRTKKNIKQLENPFYRKHLLIDQTMVKDQIETQLSIINYKNSYLRESKKQSIIHRLQEKPLELIKTLTQSLVKKSSQYDKHSQIVPSFPIPKNQIINPHSKPKQKQKITVKGKTYFSNSVKKL